MSIDKETARIKLNHSEQYVQSLIRNKITLEKNEPMTFNELYSKIENESFFDVRGGIGNKLITPLTLEERIMNQMSRSLNDSMLPEIDYFNPSTFPKEWSNIQRGKDTMKLTKKEQVYFWSIITGIVGVLGSGITILISIII